MIACHVALEVSFKSFANNNRKANGPAHAWPAMRVLLRKRGNHDIMSQLSGISDV